MPSPSAFLRSVWGRLRSAWTVDGGAWFALQAWGARMIPAWLEPPVLSAYVTLFFLSCPPPRRAVRHNLAALFPGEGRLRLTFRAWLVFLRFGATATEAMQCRQGRCEVDWEIRGREHFDQLVASPGGAILLTAHMGSSDVAAPAFADRFPRRLTMVRAPQRMAGAQRRLRRQLRDSAGFEVVYNQDEFLGADLVKRLAAGEAVALQGDRVLFDVAPMEVTLDGLRLRLPKGPFALALAARVPVYPLFVFRLGRLYYRVEVGAPFSGEAARDDRMAALERAARHWMDILLEQIRRHWDQWYVFEPSLDRVAPPPVEVSLVRFPRERPLPETPDRCATSLGALVLAAWRDWFPAPPSGDQLVFRSEQPGQNGVENAVLSGLVSATSWALSAAWLVARFEWGWIAAGLVAVPFALLGMHLALFLGASLTSFLGLCGLRARHPSRWVSFLVLAALTGLALVAWVRGDWPLRFAAAPWLAVAALNGAAFGLRTIQGLSDTLLGRRGGGSGASSSSP